METFDHIHGHVCLSHTHLCLYMGKTFKYRSYLKNIFIIFKNSLVPVPDSLLVLAYFIRTFNSIAEKLPLKTKLELKTGNSEIAEMFNDRHASWPKAQTTESSSDWQYFQKQHNRYFIRKAKPSVCVSALIENEGNPATTLRKKSNLTSYSLFLYLF